MNIDRYTKIVLTLIAAFLGVIAFSLVVPSAIAQSYSNGYLNTTICQFNTNRCIELGDDYALKVELNRRSVESLASATASAISRQLPR